MSESIKTPIAIIVAVARNGVIGRNNQLPWRLPADLKHFKATTLGKPLVMGRKTFVSLGKPLPGRTNIVITRDRSFTAEGAVVTHSLEQALRCADEIAQRDGVSEIMVIGGAEIYRQVLPLTQTLYYTRVEVDVEGDAFFPPLDWSLWRCVDEARFGEAKIDEAKLDATDAVTPAYALLRYERVVS